MMLHKLNSFPHLAIVCTHQHTATSVPILVLVVVTLSSHNIVGGGWSSATPFSVGVGQHVGIEEEIRRFCGEINHYETIEEAAKKYICE